MGRRGPPPLPPNVIAMRGTEKATRPRDLVVDQLVGEVVAPKYLKRGKARKKFDALVAKFQARGQQVVGLEDMIAVYAVQLVRWEEDAGKGIRWSAADLNALKGLAVQFYDTQASQVQSGAGAGSGSKGEGKNRFSGHGQRPRRA